MPQLDDGYLEKLKSMYVKYFSVFAAVNDLCMVIYMISYQTIWQTFSCEKAKISNMASLKNPTRMPLYTTAVDASLFSLQHFLHRIDLKCLVRN